MREGAAVGEGDELGKGIGALWATEKRRVAALRADKCCGLALRGWHSARRDDARCRVGKCGRGAAQRGVHRHCGREGGGELSSPQVSHNAALILVVGGCNAGRQAEVECVDAIQSPMQRNCRVM